MQRSEHGNPFRPGAGHMPPYLAGRATETKEFARLLEQDVVLENLVLTGLRGVGKTVLLDTFKPLAVQAGWLWVGTDLSESTSISEDRLATRMMADLAIVTSSWVIHREEVVSVGFRPDTEFRDTKLDFETLTAIYKGTPGLASDKLKAVLEAVWACVKRLNRPGLIFAYDEAQNLSDHAEKDEYPLSLMLDVFQSIQKKDIPFMLALAGLPTLMPKLVEARTFAERMFHVVFLDRLDEKACRQAILRPIKDTGSLIRLGSESVNLITSVSGGYPYFIQFICREVFDAFLQRLDTGLEPSVPIAEITRKLDNDFFVGRWARATDRQRDLLVVIAHLEHCDGEFAVQEIAELSKELSKPFSFKPFSPSHISQMLAALSNSGLVYKNRHGKYSLAVPLLGQFILRQLRDAG